MVALKRRPRGVDDERRQAEKHQDRLDPPGVATRRFAEPTPNDLDRYRGHSHARVLAGRSECAYDTGGGALISSDRGLETPAIARLMGSHGFHWRVATISTAA